VAEHLWQFRCCSQLPSFMYSNDDQLWIIRLLSFSTSEHRLHVLAFSHEWSLTWVKPGQSWLTRFSV
jgi:hypothetical protein